MNEARTVLIVSNHGEIVGGGEISLLALLEGLDRSRWNPVVVVPSEGGMQRRCQAMGLQVQVVPLPGLRRPGLALVRSIVAFRRLIWQTDAALLHANGSRAMLYAGLAGWLCKRPVIWHVRIADRDSLYDRLLAGLARKIIVNSWAVGSRFAWVPSGKIRCVHNGVDLTRFSPRDPTPGLRRSLGLPDQGPIVMSVGRFVPFKGYDHLLEAAGLTSRNMPEVQWVLVGEGELKEKLEKQCRTIGLDKTVHFLGWREDIPDLLALCDLFVLPSLGEHFGRVLIEAMAMGKPILATNAGGVPEVVEDKVTGLLVPPADPPALAQAVSSLLADPAKAEAMGVAGRRRAETRFSLQCHAAQVEGVYADLVSICL